MVEYSTCARQEVIARPNFFQYHTSQEFYNEVLTIFNETRWIKDEKVKVRHTEGDAKIVTDTQFVIHQPTTGTTRSTHIDNPLEIYAGLLYMRQRGDNAKGGDFVIYDTPEINKVVAKSGREIPKDIEKKEQPWRTAEIPPHPNHTKLHQPPRQKHTERDRERERTLVD